MYIALFISFISRCCSSCMEIWYCSIDSLPLDCQSCRPVSIS